MALNKLLQIITHLALFKTVLGLNTTVQNETSPDNVFNGIYTECILKLSYTCVQKKTLLYLKELNRLSEVSFIGEHVKFVNLNRSDLMEGDDDKIQADDSEELANLIDKAVDNFFDNHLIRVSALGKDILVPHSGEAFVGRKKRKGGGGGQGGCDDGGKKKIFMMAMMMAKMKMMMMVPAMMGMMGMMSFKGMMFSMMSFMMAKIMLLMKILEKKGSNSWSGGGDSGWAASGGGGAWMPASQDYGSGGYDANGQWQSRSIIETIKDNSKTKTKTIYPQTIYYKIDNKLKTNEIKTNEKPKIRRKRGIIDSLQSVYLYWLSRFLGGAKRQPNQKFKMLNGVKYMYYPVRPKKRAPKENSKPINALKPVVNEELNKGEIVEDAEEGRMTRRKFNKMKDNVNEAVDDNPWE